MWIDDEQEAEPPQEELKAIEEVQHTHVCTICAVRFNCTEEDCAEDKKCELCEVLNGESD